MLNRKVNEFQSAIKKFVTRLLILAAIVVFGAFAIAQAPRGGPDETPETTVPPTFTGTGNPIGEDDTSPQVVPVGYDNPEPNGFVAAQADLETVEADDDGTVMLATASYDEPVESETGVFEEYQEYENALADASDSEPSDAYPSELEYSDSFESAPPLLDEETASSNPVRSNPYRDQDSESETRTPEATIYGDTEDGDTDYPNTAYGDTDFGDTEPPQEFDGYEESVEVPVDDTDVTYEDDSLLPTPLDADSEQDLATSNVIEADSFEDDSEFVADQQLDVEQSGDARLYEDPRAYSGANTLRDSTLRDSTPRESQAVASPQNRNNDFQNRRFDRMEQIEDNPLPQYDIARRNNIRATGRPGPQNLEGPQRPSLTVEKIAPSEIQVGKPARFQIKVHNVGQVPADNVVIRDEVPEGTNFLESVPEAKQDEKGGLIWDVGTINPGDESVVTVELMPVSEGQVGSVATVAFRASATARARSTKPSLEIEHTAPRQVLVGEKVKFAIKLSNPGSGSATQVVLDEDVPQGLSHTSGPKLEYEVGTILPGQTRHLELTLTAAQPGKVVNVLVARGDAGLMAKDTIELEVIAPEIQVNIDGPKRRYLDREATFTVSVANPGTATAKNVELVAQLPRGLQFLSTNNSGHYDQSRHAVIWNLEKLPAGEMGRAQFKAIPKEMGDFSVTAVGKADRNLASEQDHKLLVEGIAALYYGVADKIDPIEVGTDTTYVITVENQGSKTANNIQFAATVPNGMKPINGTGPTQATVRGQQVIFEPIVKLPPKAKTSFQVVVQGIRPGDQKLRVEMVSDDISTPVIKEESTRVYTD